MRKLFKGHFLFDVFLPVACFLPSQALLALSPSPALPGTWHGLCNCKSWLGIPWTCSFVGALPVDDSACTFEQDVIPSISISPLPSLMCQGKRAQMSGRVHQAKERLQQRGSRQEPGSLGSKSWLDILFKLSQNFYLRKKLKCVLWKSMCKSILKTQSES